MKKILSYILISLIVFVNLLAPFSVGFGLKNKAEAAGCIINENDISFPNGFDDIPPTDMDVARLPTQTIAIKSSGCLNKNISFKITSFKDGGIDTVELETGKYAINKDSFSFDFKTGEKTCDGESCDHIWIKLIITDSKTGEVKTVNAKPALAYLCLGKDAYGKIRCNTGNGDFSWAVLSSTLPLFDEMAASANKYYYTMTSKSMYSNEIKTTPSKPFDTIDACNTDLTAQKNAASAPTYNPYGGGNTMTYTFTPCEIFSANTGSATQTVIESYSYTYKITSNGTTIDSTSPSFYATSTLTAEEACNKNRDDLLSKNSGSTASSCTRLAVNQVVNGSKNADGTSGQTNSGALPACNITSLMGCVAQGFYYILFVPTSYLFALAGTFFDYSFSYSVQDTSYRSSFVVEGWGLVRDFCNMFFIFIMLYVAIGTILSLHSMKTKETIINVVIIGLFINFSLFATQLIIDASNITARVFYNSDAIKITPKGPTGATEVVAKVADNGAIPLSAALVNKVNPQNIIINAREINKIPNRSAEGISNAETTSTDGGLGIGQFILIVILAAGINIVGFTVFITIGFLFVARVVGLWMAMILAPLAFFTYILPEMADTKMIGWKHWWPETMKMAFLAPVFIFFMYIILKFLQMDLISDASGKVGLDFLIAAIIPFVFVIILLLKAKKIAVDMSGEFGEYATKMGSAVGGMALGGAVGIGAVAMRSTIGRYGAGVADSEKWKAMEAKGGFKGFMAKNLRNIGSTAGKASFDARNTKLGASAGKGMGVDAGKGKEGGFAKARIDQKIKAEKRAKELELGENSEEMKKKRGVEGEKKSLENSLVSEIDSATVDLEKKEKIRKEAAESLRIDPSEENKTAANKAEKEWKDAKQKLANINSGSAKTDASGKAITNSDGTIQYNTHNGSIDKESYEKIEGNARQSQRELVLAKDTEVGAPKAAESMKEEAIKAAKNGQEETIKKAEEAYKQAESKAQNEANEAMATAKKIELEAIKEAASAREEATKNNTPENIEKAARAERVATTAKDNTEKTTIQTKTTQSGAIDAARKILEEAKTKAEEARKEAEAKATTDAEEFKKAATAAREAAETKVTEDNAVFEQAKKSIERIDPNTGKAAGHGKSLNDLKKELHHVDMENTKINNARKEDIAKDLKSKSSKVFNMIVTGGQYSTDAANISAHNIRMGTKTEPAPSSGGHSGGGGGGHDAHASGGGDTHSKPAGGGGHDTHAKPAAGGHDAPKGH